MIDLKSERSWAVLYALKIAECEARAQGLTNQRDRVSR